MVRTLAGLSLFLLGCAPLNTARLSDTCRGLYNACLDGCPKPAPQPDPARSQDWQLERASCTDRCNKQATACQGP